MKAATLLVLSVLAATGCATLSPVPGNSGRIASDQQAAAAAPAISDPFPPQDDNASPRLIIPVTGGPPVIGIPVGGGLFVPVTGGPPVIGISTGP
jgi:hypothetical protein